MMRGVLMCLLSAAAFVWSPRAQATTVCTATTTPLVFPAAGIAPSESTATVTITCNTFALSVVAYARVRMCLSLDGGSLTPAQITPRRMQNGFGDPLDFQIFRDPARSQVWGGPLASGNTGPVQIDLTYPVPVLGGSATATATLYGRVPAQPGAASGTFTNTFSASNATLSYRYVEPLLLTSPYPASCTTGGVGGGTTGFGFTASASVPSRCTLSTATNLEFGSVPGTILSNRDETSAVTFTCTNRTAWNVGLDNGLHAAGAIRRMRRGSTPDYVRYELYRDEPRNLRWGTTTGSDTAAGTGTGASQSVTVYGRVPSGQTVPAGSYTDTVTVTVTY